MCEDQALCFPYDIRGVPQLLLLLLLQHRRFLCFWRVGNSGCCGFQQLCHAA
jgi:hypothetical protein